MNKFKLFSLLTLLALAGTVSAAWSEPSEAPPGGNTPEPINVSSAAQQKTGNLGVGAFWATGEVVLSGALRLGESLGAGKVLTSDANGKATWETPGSGGPNPLQGFWQAVTGGIAYLDGSVGIGAGKKLLLRDQDPNHFISYDNSVDGPYISGWDGVALAHQGKTDLQTRSINNANTVVDIGNNTLTALRFKKAGQQHAAFVWDGTSGGRTLYLADASNSDNPSAGWTTANPVNLDVTGSVKGSSLCIGSDCRSAWPAGGGGGVTQITAGQGISVSGSTGNVTVSNTGVRTLAASNAVGNPAVNVGVGSGDVSISVTSEFPSGTIVMTKNSTCPPGWHKDGQFTGYFPIGANTANPPGTQTGNAGSFSRTNDANFSGLGIGLIAAPNMALHDHVVPSIAVNFCIKN